MNDKELLELAAKVSNVADTMTHDVLWNPLSDDGDCARLEAACRLDVVWGMDCVLVGSAEFHTAPHNSLEYYADHPDKQSARRRASVRAAAEKQQSV